MSSAAPWLRQFSNSQHDPTEEPVVCRTSSSQQPVLNMQALRTMPRFITLEGGDGAGKSTAMGTIKDYLAGAGHEVVITREPGGTPIAERIRELVLSDHDTENLCAQTEALLVFAARAQHLRTVILPALNRGAVVLCDRFTDSSYAYQGAGRGMPVEDIAELERRFVGIRPAGTLLLDSPVAIGRERAKSRPEPADRIEMEQDSFFERVRSCYLERASVEPDRITVIDTNAPLQDVQINLRSILKLKSDRWLS